MASVTKPTKLIVVLGSVTNGRMADRVLPQAQKIISSLGHSYEVIDPKELKVPLMEGVPLHWDPDKTQVRCRFSDFIVREVVKRMRSRKTMKRDAPGCVTASLVVEIADMQSALKICTPGFLRNTKAPEWLQETETKMLSGDAFLFLTCECNRNVGPALCNFIDYFGHNVFVSKPCGIVSYSMGSTGGVYGRSSLAQMLMDLTGVVVPATCQIPNVHSLLAEDGSFTDASSDQAKRTEKSMTKVINQTAWFANAFKNHKASYGDLPN